MPSPTMGSPEFLNAHTQPYEDEFDRKQHLWKGADVEATDPIVRAWKQPIIKGLTEGGYGRGLQYRPVRTVRHCYGANGFAKALQASV